MARQRPRLPARDRPSFEPGITPLRQFLTTLTTFYNIYPVYEGKKKEKRLWQLHFQPYFHNFLTTLTTLTTFYNIYQHIERGKRKKTPVVAQ
jgi:hypothetical protein